MPLTNDEILAQAKAKITLLPDKTQKAHLAAWGRGQDHVLSLVLKGAKDFEMHHSVTHARTLYLTEIVKGNEHSPWSCERNTLAAYKPD